MVLSIITHILTINKISINKLGGFFFLFNFVVIEINI